MPRMPVESVNVAEAKKRFSDLLGRVAYGGETVLITRRGKPMAKLVPPDTVEGPNQLAAVRGWLDADDPYFDIVDDIVGERSRRKPRVVRRGSRARSGGRR